MLRCKWGHTSFSPASAKQHREIYESRISSHGQPHWVLSRGFPATVLAQQDFLRNSLVISKEHPRKREEKRGGGGGDSTGMSLTHNQRSSVFSFHARRNKSTANILQRLYTVSHAKQTSSKAQRKAQTRPIHPPTFLPLSTFPKGTFPKGHRLGNARLNTL